VILTQPLEMLSCGHGLLEGPAYDNARGLIVADASLGGVWAFAPGASAQQIVLHRRGIGGLAMHTAGGVVVSGRNVAFKRFVGTPGADNTVVLLANDPANHVIGFNDLTTDAAGRVYVGSLGFVPMHGESAGDRPGALHLIDLDGTARVVARDILLTNGLGFSPDGKKLYHSDSQRQLIYVYDVDGNGSLHGQRPFAKIASGSPDGLAVAEDGSVWVAAVHASAVLAFNADGSEKHRIKVPLPMVTSLCFGGSDLRDLYIVTGSEGAAKEIAGGIFRMRVDVPGLARTPARVPIG
jgi:xylono-1,5-lactonase